MVILKYFILESRLAVPRMEVSEAWKPLVTWPSVSPCSCIALSRSSMEAEPDLVVRVADLLDPQGLARREMTGTSMRKLYQEWWVCKRRLKSWSEAI